MVHPHKTFADPPEDPGLRRPWPDPGHRVTAHNSPIVFDCLRCKGRTPMAHCRLAEGVGATGHRDHVL